VGSAIVNADEFDEILPVADSVIVRPTRRGRRLTSEPVTNIRRCAT
jgi:hypothetical protein